MPLRLLEGYAAVLCPFAKSRTNSGGSSGSTAPSGPPIAAGLLLGLGRKRRFESSGPEERPRTASSQKSRELCEPSDGVSHSTKEAVGGTKVLCFTKQAWRQLSVKQMAALAHLGATATQKWHSGVTHVIADVLRRTERLMCAVCRGQHVVMTTWVLASMQQGHWAEESPHALRDAAAEAELGVSLAEALVRARTRPLLHGLKVSLAGSIVGEQRRVAANIVAAASGCLLDGPDATTESCACVADHFVLDIAAAPSGSRFRPELLFVGALVQELRWSQYTLQ